MDIFDLDNVKSEKANAMLRYLRFRRIAKLFRFVELFLAVVLLSWISSRLPFAVKISGEYFRQLLSVIVSPLFIFLLGNVIVLTLVAKSGQLSGNSNAGTDLYEVILNNEDDSSPVLEPEEIVYQDKQIVGEVNTEPSITNYSNENEIEVSNKRISDSVQAMDPKAYRRSQSENLTKRECFLDRNLRRSETVRERWKVNTPAEEENEAVADIVDGLNNEEFQRRIESFIARQLKFRLEEKLAIVPQSQI